MSNRFDIDYEWLLALHQATRYVLQTRDLEEANKRVAAETKRLFGTAEITLIQYEHETPPKPAAGQSQMVIPLVTENESFGTLYIFRDQPFTEEDMDLGDEWGQSAAWALLHIQVNRRRAGFLSTLSHEFSLPLTAIKGYADLLCQKDNIPPEDRKRYADTISKNANRAISLLKDLIEQERIAADLIRLRPRSIQVSSFLRENEKWLQKNLDSKEQTLVIFSDTNETLTTDDSRLLQILNIFLDNASKYSSPRTNIMLSSQANSAQVIFQVIDHGIGIDPSEHELVFQNYYRSPDPTVRQIGGHGLGLNIAQRLVQKMGGEIGVKSQQGQGSTFWFTLPLTQK